MNQKRLLDNLKTIGVYVIDKQTHEVYYENAASRKYSGEDRIGEACFKVYGNNCACEACPIHKIDHVSVIERADLNMSFVLRSEEVTWDDHDAYMITAVKYDPTANFNEGAKTLSRMTRALRRSMNLYTEINMGTMEYKQLKLRNFEGFSVADEGDYCVSFEYSCENEVHKDDVQRIRSIFSPAALKSVADDDNGPVEVSAQFRVKDIEPEKIMEVRGVFLRDESPRYVITLTKDVTKEALFHKHADEMNNILNNVRCGVAVYAVDKEGKISIAYTNDGFERFLECSKEQLKEEAAKDTMFGVMEESREDLSNAFKRILNGEKSADVTIHVTTYKGRPLWTNVNLTAVKEEDQFFIYGTYIDVTSDISVQREFKEKYEIEKRHYQDDTTILAYAVFDLIQDRTIEMERRSPFNKIDTQFSLDGFCEDISHTIVLEDKRKEFVELFNAKNLLNKHEEGIDEQSIEYQRKLPDGKVIWVKSSFHVITDVSRNSILLFYYCNDINVNKNLVLMSSYMVDEDYDMIGSINLLDDSAIMLYGKNSSKRLSNEKHEKMEAMENYSTALEWFVQNAVVPEEREKYKTFAFVEEVKKQLKEKDSYEFILHVNDPNRGVRTKKIRYSKNQLDPNSCFFSQTDITDTVAQEEEKQKQLQSALTSAEQANEAKTTFLSRMSHDMRTPMNGVLGLATLMKSETNLDEIRRDLDQLELSGKYLLQLINDTLDVNKIESGKMELRLKPIDSEMVFGNIINNASIQAKEKGVKLSLHAPMIKHEEWVQVMADAPRLEQVIMNVISNAIKFTPSGGTVVMDMKTLSITEEEVVDQYVISDTGIGMSKEFLDHIFEPFAQEGRSNEGRESGTGLGMSIVKELVDLMNGTISIKSEVGIGTEVTIVIHYPVSKQRKTIEKKAAVDLSILKDKRFLLCEDHPLNAEIAKRLLGKMKAKVERAENGKIGLEKFEQSPEGYYDCVLMDIRMPEMNGLEATRAIRSLDRKDATTIPIIAMTANAYEDDVQDCFAAGMNAHMSKPIEPKTLYDTLATYLSKE